MVWKHKKQQEYGTYMPEFGKHCIMPWVSVSDVCQGEVPDGVQTACKPLKDREGSLSSGASIFNGWSERVERGKGFDKRQISPGSAWTGFDCIRLYGLDGKFHLI